MTDSLLIFIPCSGLPLQINADAQDSPKSMSELLPLFQPECAFSYVATMLAADGFIISRLAAFRRARLSALPTAADVLKTLADLSFLPRYAPAVSSAGLRA
ncbi:hypothetical protein CWM52_16695 [Raoultella sp. T31]|nr:hypothetical protein CWM52_16695 [Raoultella sp. T31]